MGAFAAVYIGVRWTGIGDVSPFLHWFVAVLGSLIAGALWGAIPGLLKAYRNVNEVVSSIMSNYIAMFLNSILVKELIYNQERARAMDIAQSAQTPTWGLDKIFEGSSINIGIFVAILAVAILHFILYHTTFGYELKAVGFNKDAARYAGMNERRNIVFSMMISGAIAGLAGAMMFLVIGKNLLAENVLIAEGFTGIAISLLGLSTPIGVFLAALFYGSIDRGGFYIQLLEFKPEIIDIIIGVIIYFSALSLFLKKYIIAAIRSIYLGLIKAVAWIIFDSRKDSKRFFKWLKSDSKDDTIKFFKWLKKQLVKLLKLIASPFKKLFGSKNGDSSDEKGSDE